MNKILIKLFKPPAPCINRGMPALRRLVLDRLRNENLRMLDLGSGGRKWHSRIISLDLHKTGQVSIVADSGRLPFKSSCLHFILCTAVLEHVANLPGTLMEIKRCLTHDGEIFIDIPFLQPFHADPADYRRFTLAGLKQLFAEYRCLDSGASVGPFSGIAMILRKIPAACVDNGKLALIFEALAGWLTFWLKYFDYLLPKKTNMHKVASGLFYHGKLDQTLAESHHS